MHGVEATHACGIDSSLGTAGENRVGLAQTYEVEGVDNGVVGGCASRHRAEVGTMIAIFHGNVAGGNVGNHFGNEERVVLGPVGFVEGIISGFLLECVKAADAGSNDYADAVLVEIPVSLETGILHSLTGCDHGVLRIEVKLTQLFAVEVGCGVEVLDFAGELRLELRGVEVSDGAGAGASFHGVMPRSGHIISEGSDSAKACYDNSF